MNAAISYFFGPRPSKQDDSTIPSRYRKINNGLILGNVQAAPASEVEIGLEKDQLPVRILGINRRNHGFSPSMAIVNNGRK